MTVPVGGGADSDLIVFSFHPVKTVAMGEGGAVAARDPELLRSLALLRSHGMEREASRFTNKDLGFDANGSVNPWYYEMQELGWNYRVTDIQCALGLNQLSKLDRFLARRGEIADLYDSALADLASIARPVPRSLSGTSGWHLYPILIDFDRLEATRGGDRPLASRETCSWNAGPLCSCSLTTLLSGAIWQCSNFLERWNTTKRVLSIPFYPGLSDDEVERVSEALHDVLAVGGTSR